MKLLLICRGSLNFIDFMIDHYTKELLGEKSNSIKELREQLEELAQKRILAGVPLSRLYPDRKDFKDLALMTATETTTDSDIQILLQALSESLP